MKLDGNRQSIYEINLILYGCPDPDTDYFRNTLNFKEVWESCKPKIENLPYKGSVYIFGTGGNIENNIDFKKLFYEEE